MQSSPNVILHRHNSLHKISNTYTQFRSKNCASVALRASNKISPDVALLRHFSTPFWSIILAPLYPSQTKKIALQERYEFPSEFPMTSPFSGIFHHLLGPNVDSRPYTQVTRDDCTSGALRSSNRVPLTSPFSGIEIASQHLLLSCVLPSLSGFYLPRAARKKFTSP